MNLPVGSRRRIEQVNALEARGGNRAAAGVTVASEHHTRAAWPALQLRDSGRGQVHADPWKPVAAAAAGREPHRIRLRPTYRSSDDRRFRESARLRCLEVVDRNLEFALSP